MRVRPVGRSALLISCRDGPEAEAWRAELWRRRAAGELDVREIVPGERTVLLDGAAPDTAGRIDRWTPAAADAMSDTPLLEIPTTFDGDDLGDVAALWDLSAAAAVERLTEIELTVAFCGFAPGFAYMRGLPEAWAVPRLAAPRPRVPAGSVALAGGYAGIYPTASPGGWRLVGRTEENLFDVRRAEPALLSPGTRVRLVAR
jgi:KipI family sensor histidine kinase inhibitor